MTKSRVFLYFCLSFILGILISSPIFISQLFMLGFLVLGIAIISIFWRRKKFMVIGFCLIFLAIGIWRHQNVESGIMNNELETPNDTDKNITLAGVVTEEPDIRIDQIKLKIKGEKIKVGDDWQEISGTVLVTANRYPEYVYGDYLQITGKLKPPKEFPDFNYREYLAKEGIYSVMYYPLIESLGKYDRGPTSVILAVKNQLRESIYRGLSPPQSSILAAMILGDKRKISDEWKEKLNIAGVRHITAISGMHITIIIFIIMMSLIYIGFWRQQAFYLTLVILVLYIIMIGAPPSAIRAGIMGGILLLALQVGRLNESWRAIIFAAVILLGINPSLLRFDVGFQLSFAAVIGIIFLLPIFQNLFRIISWQYIRDLISVTLAAQVFTFPILVYNFGRISLVSVPANILIVPFIPFIMISGFIFAFIGIIWQWLVHFFPLLSSISISFLWGPVWLLLTYLTELVNLFSYVPFAAVNIENVHWIWIVFSYVILGWVVWKLKKSRFESILNS